MATSEQLERETEATRARIAATLDELRGRMTPGQLVDQFVDYARDSGGGEFVRNFGNQVVGNPIPVTLVGAGLAWLMMAGRRGPPRDGSGTSWFGPDDVAAGMSEAGEGTAPRAGQGVGRGSQRRAGGTSWFGPDDVAARMSEAGDGTAPEAGDGSTGSLSQSARDAAGRASAEVANLSDHAARRAQEWARQTRNAAGEAGAELQDKMHEAGATMRDTAAAAYDAASASYDAAAQRTRQGADAIGRSARRMGDNLASGGQSLWAFLQQQPLVLAGLGLAIGGLLGAGLPSSETEDRLMGEASDAAKSQAKSFAEEQVDKGRHVAEEAWTAAKTEVDEQLQRAKDEREATLVPSDQTAQGETAGDGARRDTEQSSS